MAKCPAAYVQTNLNSEPVSFSTASRERLRLGPGPALERPSLPSPARRPSLLASGVPGSEVWIFDFPQIPSVSPLPVNGVPQLLLQVPKFPWSRDCVCNAGHSDPALPPPPPWQPRGPMIL